MVGIAAFLISPSLSALPSKQEDDNYDHQQKAESTSEEMVWRPQIEPAAAEKENKENQKQN